MRLRLQWVLMSVRPSMEIGGSAVAMDAHVGPPVNFDDSAAATGACVHLSVRPSFLRADL
jgi:hypothetical protein